jgi:hypothetical protein
MHAKKQNKKADRQACAHTKKKCRHAHVKKKKIINRQAGEKKPK